MFGYKLENFQNQNYKIAEIEKAVLDYLYINPQIQSDADFFELRFNSQEFLAKADMQKFNQYLKVFKNKSLEKRAEGFLNFINNQKQ